MVSLGLCLISSIILAPLGEFKALLDWPKFNFFTLICSSILQLNQNNSLLSLTQQFHTCDSASAGQVICCHTVYICSNPVSLSRPNCSIPSVTPFPILLRKPMTPSSSCSELSSIYLLRILVLSAKCYGCLFILYLLLLDWGHLEDKDC